MKKHRQRVKTIKHIPLPALIISSIVLVTLLISTTAWLIHNKTTNPQRNISISSAPAGQSGGISMTIPMQHAATPTPIQTRVPQISSKTPVSPLLFGTNMGLFDSNDQVLNSAATRTALQQIHTQIIRMPVRSSLAEATEIQAAQMIKSMGATPLVILRGQLDATVLADDVLIVHDMNTIFGKSIVYYEYGNEEDLQGVSVNQYTTSWNSVIPQLKRIALNANFIGPVNFQYDQNYLSTFLQNAQPRPDEISWHEYTCDDSWATSICLSHIDHWTNHIASARATMLNTINTQLPIMITEWNYAPNAVPNDGKNNDSVFMSSWTTHALQTLAANRIFASMQYSCTNTAIPLINTNGTLTTQGTMLQAQYQNIVIDRKLPIPPIITNQLPATPIPGNNTTTNGTQGFTFEDGGTDGWSGQNTTLTVQNSAAPGINGKHALHIVVGPLASSAYPTVTVDTSTLASYPQGGQTLTANIYIASNSVSLNAKVFVVDNNSQWHSASMTTLVAGNWLNVTYTLPNGSKSPPRQIGIQFNSPGGSTISTDVYVDAVSWG